MNIPEDCLIDNTSNASSSISSFNHNVLDKYGIIDLRDKVDNYSNFFLNQSHCNKSTKNHVITINSGKFKNINFICI